MRKTPHEQRSDGGAPPTAPPQRAPHGPGAASSRVEGGQPGHGRSPAGPEPRGCEEGPGRGGVAGGDRVRGAAAGFHAWAGAGGPLSRPD